MGCFSLKVTGEHQTTKMVVLYTITMNYLYHLNSWYIISEAYNVNTICRLSSVMVVGSLTNVDDRFMSILYVWCCVE